jgi:hypothetical protein
MEGEEQGGVEVRASLSNSESDALPPDLIEQQVERPAVGLRG